MLSSIATLPPVSRVSESARRTKRSASPEPVGWIGHDVLGTWVALREEVNTGFPVTVRVQVCADHGVSVVGEDLRYAAVTAGRLPDVTVELLDREQGTRGLGRCRIELVRQIGAARS